MALSCQIDSVTWDSYAVMALAGKLHEFMGLGKSAAEVKTSAAIEGEIAGVKNCYR